MLKLAFARCSEGDEKEEEEVMRMLYTDKNTRFEKKEDKKANRTSSQAIIYRLKS